MSIFDRKAKTPERLIGGLKEQFGIDLPALQKENQELKAQFGSTLQEFKASFNNYIASRTNYAQYQFQDYTVAKIVQELYLKDPVVSACIGRYQMHYPEPFRLIKQGKRDSTDKDLIDLERNPNPWMTESKLDRYEITYQLWTGNSYTLIIKDDSGKPFQKFPFSGLNMFPVPSFDKFIDRFHFVTAEGLVSRIEVEDVIFKPWISIDPRRNFVGISPMQLCSRDIQTNIGLTEFMATYINNLDVPGLVLSRTGKDAEFAIGMGDNSYGKELINGVHDTDAEDIKAQAHQRLSKSTGGSGNTIVADIGWSATPYGFPLKDIVVEGAYCVPQTNICSNFYISPEYIKVEAGLRSSTYDNQATSKLDFFQGVLTTMWTQNSDEETKMLRMYYGDDVNITFDMSQVATLKDFRSQALGKVMPALTNLQQLYFSGQIPSREACMANAENMLAGLSDIDLNALFPIIEKPKEQKPDLSQIKVNPNGAIYTNGNGVPH